MKVLALRALVKYLLKYWGQVQRAPECGLKQGSAQEQRVKVVQVRTKLSYKSVLLGFI